MENTIVNIKTLPLNKVRIHDTFWSYYINLVRNVVVPYQWEALNDRIPDAEPSHAIRNFKIAAGEEQGEFIPYFAWANRGLGEMRVWVNELTF